MKCGIQIIKQSVPNTVEQIGRSVV